MVDRYDAMTVLAMLLTSVAIVLNLIFLQATAAAGLPDGRLVLIPIFGGVALGLSGLIEHIRRRGRDMVIVRRICAGAVLHLSLSVAIAALYQPRF
jgi:hypothetical protein